MSAPAGHHRRALAVVLLGPLALAPGACSPRRAVVSIRGAAAYQDPALLARAWALPAAARYGSAEALSYQKNFSFCGPASLVNVMNSLGDGSVTQDNVFAGTSFSSWSALFGMSLDRLGELARQRSSRRVAVLRDLTLEQLRQHLRAANRPDRRYIVNFDRGPLFGSGGGHHSPIGGYLEAEDPVLVLDTNRGFRPWLLPSGRLFQAMDTVDGGAGKKRGLLLIQ